MHWRDLPLNPSRNTLRWFAFFAVIFLSVVAASQYWRGNELAATLLWALAPLIGALGLFFPALLRPVFVGSLIVTFPIGWLVSRVLLKPSR